MPKSNKPPKYSKMGKYAVVYVHCKPRYLGLYGSEESKIEYARFIAELQVNPTLATIPQQGKEKHVTVRELTVAFLDHAAASTDPTEFGHYRIVILDFVDKLYGDDTPVDEFKPSSLKLVRDAMIQSRRFCRKILNRCVNGIVSVFARFAVLPVEHCVNPTSFLLHLFPTKPPQ